MPNKSRQCGLTKTATCRLSTCYLSLTKLSNSACLRMQGMRGRIVCSLPLSFVRGGVCSMFHPQCSAKPLGARSVQCRRWRSWPVPVLFTRFDSNLSSLHLNLRPLVITNCFHEETSSAPFPACVKRKPPQPPAARAPLPSLFALPSNTHHLSCTATVHCL